MATQPPARLGRLLAYVRPYQAQFLFALGLTILLSMISPMRPWLLQFALDHPVVQKDTIGLRNIMLGVIGLVSLQTLLQYWHRLYTNLLAQNIMNDLRNKVFKHLLSLRLKYFDLTPVGTLQTRTISDIETLNNVFSEGLITIVGELLQVIAILLMMFYTDWRLSLVVLIVLPILLVATKIFQSRVRQAFQEVRKAVSQLNAFLQEHITGMLVTQIFNREQEEYRRFTLINQKHRDANLDTVLYYSVFFPVIEIISALGTALLVWYGAGQVLEKQITFGVLVAFLMYVQMFFRPIRMMADQFNTLQQGLVSAERLFAVLDTNEVITDATDVLTEETAIQLVKQPFSVRFEKLSFAYNDNEPVLHSVSFEVPAGTTTAIVGATGSGKSSIINTLLRFYEFEGGDIFINNVNIRKIPQTLLRQSIGFVQQDVFLFSGSIYENITLFDTTISLEAVQAAATQLGADSFISQFPGGYHYSVGERGSSLSTGQRQIIAFIRVLVHNPSLLILDEATANVDSETELLIQNAITKLLEGRTAIIIAHRLSTIRHAHQILVLQKGILAEKGTHEELLAQNGLYRNLYDKQFAGQTAL